MSLQNLIEERKKELDELIRIQGVSGMRAFHSNSINMIIEGVVEMVCSLDCELGKINLIVRQKL